MLFWRLNQRLAATLGTGIKIALRPKFENEGTFIQLK